MIRTLRTRSPLPTASAACCLLCALPLSAHALDVGRLRCEFRENPLGIDANQPRLSWQLASDQRNQRQTAYQVVVASTPQKLAAGEADLWDSGRVVSDQSQHVRYEGDKLASHDTCHWKVRAWDRDGQLSAWSAPARWSMGILDPQEWQAEWIGLDGEKRVEHLTDARWIWHPEGSPAESAPAGQRFFRQELYVSMERKIRKATLRYTADDRTTVYLNGRDIGSRSGAASTKEMDLTHRLDSGRNVLAAVATNEGDAAGLIAWLKIEYESGDPLLLWSDSAWRATDREEPGWYEPDFDDSHWQQAQDLGPVGMEPWGPVRYAEERTLPARYLRKDFTLGGDVERAVAYLSGQGLSELFINGKRVGDHVLSPGLTEYPERLYYVTHDVTEVVRRGENALGVILGNGRFYAPRSEVYASMPTFGFPKLLLHLRVEYVDGTVDQVVSDTSWQLSADGPIRANNEFDGETYDARREFEGWTEPGFNSDRFQAAPLAEAPEGKLATQPIEPIRVTETLTPVEVTEPEPGVFIFDMGQNMVGWCRLQVRGPAGSKIRLRHAETLNDDGTLFLANLRGARATDYYTLKGEGTETWEPRFTYHGFRYVEVTGYPGRPPKDTVVGRVVHDDLLRVGQFECSNPLLNQILENAVWGFRGNYRSIPTDCPQRDERQGWLGDRTEVSRGETYLFDVAAFYAKWVQDFADSQKESGSVPDVSPAHWPAYTDNVTWPSATVIVPNSQLRQYADRRLIATHYASARRWIEHMLQFVEDDLISRDNYGDWCMPPEDPHLIHSQDPARTTDPTLLATSFFYYDLSLAEKFARLLEKNDDAERYAQIAEKMKTAFNVRFLDREQGQYDNGTQTSSVLPLAFGLVPEEHHQQIVDHLASKVMGDFDGHIGTGLVGGQYLMRALALNGRSDVAYTIATQTDYPSWGYMIDQGATTVWELWNGNTANPAMNSHNHVMLLGDYVLWLFEHLGGIAPDENNPGFKHIIMRPDLVDGLDWVKASFDSPYGRVMSHWQKSDDGQCNWSLTIPPNTTATVHVPAASADTTTESGTPLTEADGIQLLRTTDDRAVIQIGSGTYRFESEVPSGL